MTTPPRKSIVRIVLRAALCVAIPYAVVCVVVYFNQDSMIFPTHLANDGAATSGSPSGVEQVFIAIDATDPSERVEGWFLIGAGRSPENPGPAVMFFHGNGDLIDYALDVADMYRRRGISVLLPEYRGYGRSAGAPSQDGITRDMIQFRAWLDARPEADAAKVIYHGQSLGGGVAASLADERPPCAFILQSSFTSMSAMANSYLLPGFLVRHPFRVDETIARLQLPTLILHGSGDAIIPASHGRKLHELLRTSIYIEMPSGHNDFPFFDQSCLRAVDDFLRSLQMIEDPDSTSRPRE